VSARTPRKYRYLVAGEVVNDGHRSFAAYCSAAVPFPAAKTETECADPFAPVEPNEKHDSKNS